MQTQVIALATASEAYEIVVGQGLLTELYPRLRRLATGRCIAITSPNIWAIWGARFLASFPLDAQPLVLFVPAGEGQKRIATIDRLAEEMAAAGADRDTLLIAFGGGVVGDITGFLAAIYMRGVPFVQVPTTLLAQVDSSVGGKTGVNLAAGKNLLGSFYQPLAVLVDLDLLSTLPTRELRAGLQEAVKAGAICDLSLLCYMAQNAGLAVRVDAMVLRYIIARSIEIKAAVVEADEREAGLRMTLNFGHTIGHAIEAATGYGQLLHGEAVAWGSLAALQVGLQRGALPQREFDQVAECIRAYGPLPHFEATAEELVKLSALDKKVRSGRRAFVLPTAAGRVEIVYDVSDAELLRATRAMLMDMQANGVEAATL